MMTEADQTDGKRGSRRIVVLLDASRPSVEALHAAIDRAVLGKAELHALFVEEEELLRSAGFAFAREIGATSGTPRPLRGDSIEARLRRQAARVSRELEKALAGRDLTHSMSVRRGRILTEVLSLAGPEDLVILGKVGWSAAPGRALGSTALALVREAPGSVLLWSAARARRGSDVIVVVDDFERSRHALGAGAELAEQRGAELSVVLIPPEDPETVPERDRAVSDWLADTDVRSRTRKFGIYDPEAVARVIRFQGGSELIISRRSRLMRDVGAEAFLHAVSMPVGISP